MSLKRTALSVISMVGLDQYILKIYDSITSGEPGLLSNLHVESRIQTSQIDHQQDRKRILLPLFGISERMCLRTFILSYAFYINGYKPTIIYNIDTLPARSDISSRALSALNEYILDWFQVKFPAECISCNNLLEINWEERSDMDIDRDINKPHKYCGVDISDSSLASTRKELRQYSIDLENESHYKLYSKHLIRGRMIAEATTRLINRFEYDAVIAWDVYYNRGRIPLEICDKNGIKAYTHETGYNKGYVGYGNMRNKSPNWRYMNKEMIDEILNTPLSTDNRKEIDDVMSRREANDPDYNEHTIGANSSINTSDNHIVGVFSHLLWDGALEPQQAIYSDFYDWLEDTIRVGANIENTEFIIKSHPAESIRGTSERLVDWINKNYTELPKNFTFLSSDTDVDTYQLINELDTGVVYASTVGLEMVFNGVPVITGGYPPYRDLGITIDPDTKNEYRNRLKQIKEYECNKEQTARARRFAHILFCGKQLEFPHLYEYLSDENKQITISHDEILDGLNPVVEQIINDEEVLAKLYRE